MSYCDNIEEEIHIQFYNSLGFYLNAKILSNFESFAARNSNSAAVYSKSVIRSRTLIFCVLLNGGTRG